MKTNKRVLLLVCAAVIVIIALARPLQVPAQTAAATSSSGKNSAGAPQWSVQVVKVDPGDVDLEPSFQIAIYERLLDEFGKTKRFKQVFRDGDRNASEVPDLLILKTTVQKYTAGSETKRAVTTVSGATKLTVRSQLCTRDGKIILERTVSGNVRFLGSNLRATHNLAHNVAKAVKQSSLSQPSVQSSQTIVVSQQRAPFPDACVNLRFGILISEDSITANCLPQRDLLFNSEP